MKAHRVFAAIYDRMNEPFERAVMGAYRSRWFGGLTGAVLDVGAGTGANLRHLRHASRVIAVEPDPAMRRRLEARVREAAVPVEVGAAAAESLPFADGSFDAVVFGMVLCSVADPARALAEARRVLAPGGRLAVLEHVRGTGAHARWQDRVTPVWSLMNAGCHPNRDTRAAIERAGFVFEQVEVFEPVPGWLPVTPWLAGIALRSD